MCVDVAKVRIEKRLQQLLPHQKEQTYLEACRTLEHRGSEQNPGGPASVPPASWLCSRSPAGPSHCWRALACDGAENCLLHSLTSKLRHLNPA